VQFPLRPHSPLLSFLASFLHPHSSQLELHPGTKKRTILIPRLLVLRVLKTCIAFTVGDHFPAHFTTASSKGR
jgi:hypothetical protein